MSDSDSAGERETRLDDDALRTDGGEQEQVEEGEEERSEGDEEEQEAEGEQEQQEGEAEGDDEQEQQEEEAEGEDEQEQQEEEAEGEDEQEEEQRRTEDFSADSIANEEEGTGVLYLDLQGLELDLLGLDVDVSELVVDIEAVEGDGNLLGNVLSSVAGLLDGGLGSLLDGLAMDFDIGEKLSSAFDSIKSALSDAFEQIPVGDVLTQVLMGVVSQVFGLDMDDEQSEESEESESSDESEEEGEGNEESEE